MIASAMMYYGFWKAYKEIAIAELEMGDEHEDDGTLPFWFCAAPMVVDILSFYFIAQAL